MNDPELRAAFARLDAALAEARAALEKPEPEQEQEQEPEPEPPSVEVVSRRGDAFRAKRITRFERAQGYWLVWGRWVQSEECYGSISDTWIDTATSPFLIWQAALAAGVECCEPPTIIVRCYNRDYAIAAVHSIGKSGEFCACYKALGGSLGWMDHGLFPTRDVAKLRADCREAGVPCPEEEKSKTVTVAKLDKRFRNLFRAVSSITAETLSGNTCCFRAVSAINAVHRDVDGPCLRIVGDSQFATHVFTRTPLADIRAQAADAGIELPDATVFEDGTYWRSISCVECRWGTSGIHTAMFGDRVDYDPCQDGVYTDLTPAQVISLCALAGWPKPEVRCEFRYCDGTVFEVDPADVRTATLFRRDTAKSKHTQIELFAQVDGSRWRDVREPVAVVQRMIDACKGDDSSEHTE